MVGSKMNFDGIIKVMAWEKSEMILVCWLELVEFQYHSEIEIKVL